MEHVLAVVCPGQGAQTPGFLSPWLEIPSFAERLSELSDHAGLDLVRYGSTADAETIRDTKVAQPLLVGAALATAFELGGTEQSLPRGVDLAAGHSVGEIAAAAIAGVLSLREAMVLVGERGRSMAEAAAITPTTMAAVLAGNPEDVLARIEELGLTAANNNGPGQIVAGGTTDQIAELIKDPPARARVVPLSVAGAFHTVHMSPAIPHLQEVAGTLAPRDPAIHLLSNRDGADVTSGADYLARLVGQIAHPVRWDLCMQTMTELGVTGLLEWPPAGTLTKIAKRAMKGVEVFALNTPDQLEDAKAFLAAHSTTLTTPVTE